MSYWKVNKNKCVNLNFVQAIVFLCVCVSICNFDRLVIPSQFIYTIVWHKINFSFVHRTVNSLKARQIQCQFNWLFSFGKQISNVDHCVSPGTTRRRISYCVIIKLTSYLLTFSCVRVPTYTVPERCPTEAQYFENAFCTRRFWQY
jgi:hypothetical protein